MTQVDLANKAEVDQPLVSKAEAGKVHLFPHQAKRIARVLGVDPGDLAQPSQEPPEDDG